MKDAVVLDETSNQSVISAATDMDKNTETEESQKVVVQTLDDYYSCPMFNLDVCTDFENNTGIRSRLLSEGLGSLPDSSTASFDSGIEALDVDSLLDQFEEASSTLGDSLNLSITSDDTQGKSGTALNSQFHASSKPGTPTPPATPSPTDDVIQKIKAGSKRKSTILLPMGVPTKRGRGQAATLPASYASRSFQKLMKANSSDESMENTGQLSDAALLRSDQKESTLQLGDGKDVSESYYDQILDHDYCQNAPKLTIAAGENTDETANSNDVNDCAIVNDENSELNDKENKSKRYSKFENESDHTRFKQKGDGFESKRRNYRRREETPAFEDKEQYYDKIPKYYSVLARPVNVAKSSAMSMTVNDSLPERDPSPQRNQKEAVYNKLPAYHSCFTNSTKYDDANLQSTHGNSPLVIDSRAVSRSRSGSLSSSQRHNRSRSRSYSRSRSRSKSRNKSHSSKYSSRHSSRRGSRPRYSSRSNSRGRSKLRRSRRKRSYSSSSRSYSRSRSRSYSRSRSPRDRHRKISRSSSAEREDQEKLERREKEKLQQIEERRIIYVGKIPSDYTRIDLRRRFERFGEIEEISVHFRECGDNYGFVTFAYTCDAYAAIEKGNDASLGPKFDLCFGGRRHYCKTDYADLDGDNELREEWHNPAPKISGGSDFDDLLQQAIKKIKKKK